MVNTSQHIAQRNGKIKIWILSIAWSVTIARRLVDKSVNRQLLILANALILFGQDLLLYVPSFLGSWYLAYGQSYDGYLAIFFQIV